MTTPVLLSTFLQPFLATYILLFVLRICLSWYPQLDAAKPPYVWIVIPTEFLLAPTRRLIPPLGGVDLSPVIWVGVVSFLRELLLGQQGILTLLTTH